MSTLSRLLLVVLLALAGVRAVLFGLYALAMFSWPLEAFQLESKMVHLAWRVQEGLRLYPDWRSYPHVANFFAPIYFVIVGLIGRVGAADLDALYSIGRSITLASTLLTALLLGIVVERRYGRGAGLLGALLSLGIGPLFGFGLMTRPDALADLIGVAGFFAATNRRRWGLPAGALLLVLAVLTKQTCAAYLVAALLTLLVDGRRRASAILALASCGGLVAIVAGVTLLVESNFGPSLLAEARTPWDAGAWRLTAWRIVALDPEWVVLAVAGLVVWNTGTRRDLPATVLTIVLLAATFTTIAKRGSDLNYALGLRAVEALAGGALWDKAWSGETRSRLALITMTAAGILACVLMAPSLNHAYIQANVAALRLRLSAEPSGRSMLAAYRLFSRVAADPSHPILTDSGFIDVQQRERTAFGDPWLFRMLVETGQIAPTTMASRVETEHYDWIITTKDLFDPSYASYDFGLPMAVVEPARRHYRLRASEISLFIYSPKSREVAPPPGAVS